VGAVNEPASLRSKSSKERKIEDRAHATKAQEGREQVIDELGVS
jgi:hypothetical protein